MDSNMNSFSSPTNTKDNTIPPETSSETSSETSTIWYTAAEFIRGQCTAALTTITSTMSSSATFMSQKEPHQAPFEELAHIQQVWREREPTPSWSADKMESLDLEDIDWQNFAPPAVLRETPAISSRILVDIVEQSIENVRTRATEEYRQRREEEERRLAEETEARKAKRTKDLFLPIIIVEDAPVDDSDPINALDPQTEGARALSRIRAQAVADLANEKKRSLLKSNTSPGKFFSKILRRKADILGADTNDVDSTAWEALRDKLRESSNTNDGSGSITIEESNEVVRQSRLVQEEPEQEELVECVSCLDEFPHNSCVKVPCHSYCPDCFASLISISVQNEQQWPPKCCLNEIPHRTIMRYIPEGLKSQFTERSSEWKIPVSERIYCSRPDCSLWVKPNQVNHAGRVGHCDRGHRTCTMCRGQEHGQQDCPQDRDLNLTNQLAEEEGWKRCLRCQALVEHRDACQHMTCRCGAEFCYVCGRVWQTCSCTMQQLQAIKDAARDRRRQREAREQEESEELRQALAEIEAFEREEAVKAEIQRQERIRLEEERQQRELEERVRKEILRRRQAETKFELLRPLLDLIHSTQDELLMAAQEQNARDLAQEMEQALEAFETKTATELSDMDAYIRRQMSDKEFHFNKDLAARSAAEKGMVDAYQKQLEEFWRNKAGGNEEIEKALQPLHKKMEQGYTTWQAWKDSELERYGEKLEEKRAMREELAYSARQRLRDKHEAMELDLVRRAVSEQKWLHMVVLERERMLAQVEVEEVEGDADSLFARDSSSEASSVRSAGDNSGEGPAPRD